MTKEEQFFAKRLLELSNTCFQKNIPVYTDFLNLNEQNIFYYIKQELPPVQINLIGGHKTAERRLLGFTPLDMHYESVPPISILEVKAAHEKFSDKLTHRDYLGAILNLGIERGKIGDILVDEFAAYVFCLDSMAEFLIANLEKIKHTNIRINRIEDADITIKPKIQEIQGSVSSTRLDSILALAFQASRSSITQYISGGKVFINGKLVESNSYVLKRGDIVSVRGLGRFSFGETLNQTKKGRYFVVLYKYI